MSNIIYTIKEFAEEIGKSENTLRRWDKESKLIPAFRGKSNKYRYYSYQQLEKYFNENKKENLL